MPAGPYLNFLGRPGACGYLPPRLVANLRCSANQRDESLPAHLSSLQRPGDAIVQFDSEANQPVRTDKGRCRTTNSFGELVFLLAKPEQRHTFDRAPYRGYTNARASKRKLYFDVFAAGDVYFATGDLLRVDDDGFFYFHDRAGESFRWKGETVSTNEVSDAITAAASKLELALVEHVVSSVQLTDREGRMVRDGRAGHAILTVSSNADVDQLESVDLERFSATLCDQLPHYAIPVFVTLTLQSLAVTSTLKLQKVHLSASSTHELFFPKQPDSWTVRSDLPKRVTFVHLNDQYQLLTQDLLEQIIRPSFRF